MSCNLVFIKIQSHLPKRSFGIKLLHINPQLEILPGIFFTNWFTWRTAGHHSQQKMKFAELPKIYCVMKNGTSMAHTASVMSDQANLGLFRYARTYKPTNFLIFSTFYNIFYSYIKRINFKSSWTGNNNFIFISKSNNCAFVKFSVFFMMASIGFHEDFTVFFILQLGFSRLLHISWLPFGFLTQ